jgi:hypothetical protein
VERIRLGALMTIDVHGRDVRSDLVENEVRAGTDLDWIGQFGYYWEKEDVDVKMMESVLFFSLLFSLLVFVSCLRTGETWERKKRILEWWA